MHQINDDRELMVSGFNSHSCTFEGTADIDVQYTEAGKFTRIHIQVKDHAVSPSELKSVLQRFSKTDAEHPDTYKRFTLVCPSLTSTLRPIENGLARLRGAAAFYEDKPQALAPTKEELDERLRKAGLGDHIDFLHAKVFRSRARRHASRRSSDKPFH